NARRRLGLREVRHPRQAWRVYLRWAQEGRPRHDAHARFSRRATRRDDATPGVVSLRFEGHFREDREGGAIVFGKEPDDPKKQDSLFWVGALLDNEFVGRSATLQEIDFIAVMGHLEGDKGTKTCTGYVDSENKPVAD